MIEVSAEEYGYLATARGILKTKESVDGGGLAHGVGSGLELFIKQCQVTGPADMQAMQMSPNPIFAQGDSLGSPDPDPRSNAVWGKPFTPKHPTQPKVETKPVDLGDDPDGDIEGHDYPPFGDGRDGDFH